MRSHSGRVAALSWSNHLLTSGSEDSEIHHHDVRDQKHLIERLLGHEMEVCALKWSADGTKLASGGNDGRVCIWTADTGATEPVTILRGHQAAVKVCY